MNSWKMNEQPLGLEPVEPPRGSPYSLAKTHIDEAISAARAGQGDKSLSGREAALVITKLEEASLWLTQASAKA